MCGKIPYVYPFNQITHDDILLHAAYIGREIVGANWAIARELLGYCVKGDVLQAYVDKRQHAQLFDLADENGVGRMEVEYRRVDGSIYSVDTVIVKCGFCYFKVLRVRGDDVRKIFEIQKEISCLQEFPVSEINNPKGI